MRTSYYLLLISILLLISNIGLASDCKGCCTGNGRTLYCDTSAGRYVCTNGEYSTCFCTRHAEMNIQKVHGCCLWQGGVFKRDEKTGFMICNNGGISEMCSKQYHVKRTFLY